MAEVAAEEHPHEGEEHMEWDQLDKVNWMKRTSEFGSVGGPEQTKPDPDGVGGFLLPWAWPGRMEAKPPAPCTKGGWHIERSCASKQAWAFARVSERLGC